MYGLDPLLEASSRDYENAGTLVNKLGDCREDLYGKIGYWQNSIKDSDTRVLSKEERNILNWYKFNNVSYNYSNLRIDVKTKDLLKKFVTEDPNYIFKNIIEVVSRELLSKFFRSLPELENTSIKVLTTSDFDDIKSGVDIIVKLTEEDGTTSILGLDVAVSSSLNRLNNKQIKTITFCKEYNLSEGNAPKEQIPRKILYFDPEIMSDFVYEYLIGIEKGKIVNILDLYREVLKRNGGASFNYTHLESGIKASVSNILQIY